MQKFTIRDIENMCGIKAHTLRIWEQRYPFFSAKRTASKHRFYDNEDLKKMLRIAYLYHNKWKASRIATLSETEILEQVRKDVQAPENYPAFVVQLLEAALDFDELRFSQLLEHLIATIGMERCIRNVCYPFLQKTGLLWMTSNLIPAQEHFSSYLIQHKVIAETDKLPPADGSGGTLLLFTPDGEHHELPLLFINYLLRKNGKRTLYLGTNVKWQNVQTVGNKPEVSTLYLHVITNFTRFEIDDYLEQLSKAFRDKKIVASGAAVLPAQRSFVNMQVLKSDEEIYRFITGTPSTSAARTSPHLL